jgi:hypothetical protein
MQPQVSQLQQASPYGPSQVRLGDLNPLQDAAHTALRPELQALSDAELLNAATKPADGRMVTINTRTGNLADGNGRVLELLRRAQSGSSSITPDTQIPVDHYTPDLSMFPDLY